MGRWPRGESSSSQPPRGQRLRDTCARKDHLTPSTAPAAASPPLLLLPPPALSCRFLSLSCPVSSSSTLPFLFQLCSVLHLWFTILRFYLLISHSPFSIYNNPHSPSLHPFSSYCFNRHTGISSFSTCHSSVNPPILLFLLLHHILLPCTLCPLSIPASQKGARVGRLAGSGGLGRITVLTCP